MTQRTPQNQHGQAAPNQTNKSSTSSGTKRFSDHIGELRKRAFFIALVFIAASSLAYNYHDFFVSLIMRPLGQEKLIYLTPGGGFNFIFQVSLYAGLLAAAPVFIHQLYGFIKPALPKRAQRSAAKVVAAAFLLMICGVCFGYFVAIPSALNFLSTFAGSDITPNLTADSYLSFFLAYIAGLGILFELPLLLLFFHWIHPMTPGGLLKSERFIILFAFVASAIITPTPDVFNQSMIAVPLIAIYQCGVITVLFTIRKERRRAKTVAKDTIKPPSPPSDDGDPRPQPRLVTPVLAPQPAAATLQVVTPVATKQPMQRRQSIDGFGSAPRRTVTVPPRIRPRAAMPVPTRPAPGQKSQYTRTRLSVDGFFAS